MKPPSPATASFEERRSKPASAVNESTGGAKLTQSPPACGEFCASTRAGKNTNSAKNSVRRLSIDDLLTAAQAFDRFLSQIANAQHRPMIIHRPRISPVMQQRLQMRDRAAVAQIAQCFRRMRTKLGLFQEF